MTLIHIRPFSEADVEGFHACLDAVARERKYLGLLAAPPLENTRLWLLNALRRDEIRLVAVAGEPIVGWCDIELYPRPGFEHTGKLGMGVLNGYRGQGLGRRLLESALTSAQTRSLERVELEVYASNEVAVRLYTKFGFQIEGRKRRARKIDGDYDDIVVMARLFEPSAD